MEQDNRSPLDVVLVLLLLASGLAVTGYGFWQQDWPGALPTKNLGQAAGYLYFIAGAASVIAMAAKFVRFGHAATTVLLGLLIAVLAGGVWPLLAVAFQLGASFSLGHLVLRFFSPPDSALDRVYRILVGASVYATLVGIGAHFKVNYAWVYLLALAFPLVVARAHMTRLLKATLDQLVERRDGRQFELEASLLGAIVLLYFAMAFLPELSHDPLAMHLLVPAGMAANHAWNFDPSLYVWTFMPMLADWSFTIAYVFAGESAARLVNLGFLLICVAFVREFVFMLGGRRRGANWAALLVLTTPLTLLVGCSLYVETYWSACLLAGILWVFRAVYAPNTYQFGLVPGAIGLGFAAAAKSVALPYMPLLALPVIHRIKMLRSGTFRLALLVGAGAFLVLGAWPYALAFFKTGNPVFPFFNSLFESPLFRISDFNNTEFNESLSWNLPYLLVFFAERFGTHGLGGAGFQWLTLALPAFATLLFLRAKQAVILYVIAILGGVAVFQFQTYLRYIFPVILLLGVVIGLSISHCRQRHRVLHGAMLISAALTVALNLLYLGSATAKYRDVPVLQSFHSTSEDQLIRSRAPTRKAVELINVVNPQHYPVAILASPTVAGIDAQPLFASWYNPAFVREIRQGNSPGAVLETLRRYRAKYLILDSRGNARNWPIAGFAGKLGPVIGEIGSVAVYRVADELYFARELLRAPNRFDLPPWSYSSDVEFLESGAVAVVQGASVRQDADVRERDFYLNTMRVRCMDGKGRARVQVNWRRVDGARLGTNIRVFHCDRNWSVVGQQLVAPEGATVARVFGTGQDRTRVEISGISFRGVGVERAAPAR